MPKTCARCEKTFPFIFLFEGKLRNLKNRFCCTECIPFDSNKRHRKKTRLPGVCLACNEKCLEEEFYNNSDGKPFPRCKACMRAEVMSRSRALKAQAVEYKGGVCLDCGNMPNLAAMDFHHRDPKIKDFEISCRKGVCFDNIIDELNKCDLLCKTVMP